MCKHHFIFPQMTLVSIGHLCGIALYSHIFQALEDFLWQSCDMLDRMEDMREDLNHNDFADDASGAKKALEAHNEAKRKILKVPVENIDNVGQRLLQRYAWREGDPSNLY